MYFSAGTLVFDPEMIRRFDVNGPRYTSYPTADRFVDTFDAEAFRSWLSRRPEGETGRPLSLYVHLPFCSSLCHYCACNKIVTADHGRSRNYLKYLEREMALQTESLTGSRNVVQLHWGGGTPTFLPDEEMRQLMAVTQRYFQLLEAAECSIEVDPRQVGGDTVACLADLGFNRMSLGVQDFDPAVQQAIHRVQSREETERVMASARDHGFKSIAVDLIYGLPRQSVTGFSRTLDEVLAMRPDRLSLYNFAYLPGIFKPQRRIAAGDLPSPGMRLEILARAIQKLIEAGYVHIGMDHFAKPEDELAVAQREGLLQRNFQGYSTWPGCDLLAFGVSAISNVGACYGQNFKTLEAYYARLDQNLLPIARGIELNADDLLRRAVIQALMCQFEISIEVMESACRIDFRQYFAAELEELRELEAVGLVRMEGDWITVLPAGRLLVRAVAMIFDRYLRVDRPRTRYSRVI